jgi:hypothetical protein
VRCTRLSHYAARASDTERTCKRFLLHWRATLQLSKRRRGEEHLQGGIQKNSQPLFSIDPTNCRIRAAPQQMPEALREGRRGEHGGLSSAQQNSQRRQKFKNKASECSKTTNLQLIGDALLSSQPEDGVKGTGGSREVHWAGKRRETKRHADEIIKRANVGQESTRRLRIWDRRCTCSARATHGQTHSRAQNKQTHRYKQTHTRTHTVARKHA